MRLTVKENPETIKRYAHLRPAPLWGSARCGVPFPGTPRSCTLEKGHRGPHAAHGPFKRVVAVWDAGFPVRKSDGVAVDRAERNAFAEGGAVTAWKAFRNVVPDMETGIYLTFFVAFVGFVIYWLLLILGVPL